MHLHLSDLPVMFVNQNISLARVHTSAITAILAIAVLARNPRAMNKAQDEFRRYIGKNGRVTEKDIDQLQYLKMIIKETLRLHAVAPLTLPRETISL